MHMRRLRVLVVACWLRDLVQLILTVVARVVICLLCCLLGSLRCYFVVVVVYAGYVCWACLFWFAGCCFLSCFVSVYYCFGLMLVT